MNIYNVINWLRGNSLRRKRFLNTEENIKIFIKKIPKYIKPVKQHGSIFFVKSSGFVSTPFIIKEGWLYYNKNYKHLI